MPQPHIRTARPEDGEELGALDRAAWSTLHEVTPEPQPPYRPFFGDRYPVHGCLVAELDGRIAGYVRLAQPTPFPASAHVRQIQGIAVAREARGHGVGRALVRAAIDSAREQGARRITLRVLGHNTPARGLYTAEGFEVEGVLPEEFLIGGTYVDDVLMGRPL
ncbi:GNAT family N-acetyltransferase [Streptomyces sp. NBC_00820]|uniref:GNAT family N-acetyltransferase n=1 Tax=Streptomyces sp. NBC_00820 TaxID=2975842 RepID=UPI002ED5256B|nr:GNAT family N-acetyltransferase [Streptomyces sp. NBC_00820]